MTASRRCPVCAMGATLYEDDLSALVRCDQATCRYEFYEDPAAPWREGLDWRPGAPTYATDNIYYKFIRSFKSTAEHRRKGSF